MRTYAIGDIHGQIDLLTEVHGWIEEDRAGTGDAAAPVVHVGDFVDRGADVRSTLDYLIAGQSRAEPWVFLKGNHDRMMWHFLQPEELPDPLRHDLHWLIDVVGGRPSLQSYGVDVSKDRAIADIHAEAREKVPQAHLDFLGALPATYRRGGAFFCHAGIRPGVALEDQAEDDLVWIRKEFHDDTRDHGALIVHGHTPIDEVTLYANRLNLDTGAAYGKPLSAVVIEGDDVFQITTKGRVALRALG